MNEETLEEALKELKLIKDENQERVMRILEGIFSKFLFYAGEWHEADCASIFYDHGVCNCDYEKNREEIKNKLF